ncbi:MAG: adenosine deaminase [Chitinophagaceae bacterium]|nr:adenosine deaminase [Anaerolineae bacterium]
MENVTSTHLTEAATLSGNPFSEEVRALPKIELHRHLEGSVRLETLVDIAQQHGIEMPEYEPETLRPFVQMIPDEPRTWQNFLAKFKVLRQFFLSPGIITRITREIIADAAADNIKYMELRFTPQALCQISRCTPEDVVALVCETTAASAAEHGIDVRLIVSINRNESLEIGERALYAALDNREHGIVGFDLAGSESGFPATPFRELFRKAEEGGLGLTLHAGEWDGAQSVWDAVGNLGAERVGHGIRVLEDPGIVRVLMERGVVLEVCPTSTVDSGVVASFSSHPIPQLIANGLKVTINTDDPSVSAITLSDEIDRTMVHLAFTMDDVKRHTLIAAHAAFLPEKERAALVAKFEKWLYPR